MSNGRILIVEDNPDIREVLSLLLHEQGFEVFTAKDSTSGYEKLLRHEPDLVITDLMLPDYSGLEFIRWVRQKAGLADLPIIAMTSFENGYLVAAQHLGADIVIRKPEGFDDLTEAINAVMKQKPRPQGCTPSAEPDMPQDLVMEAETLQA